MNSRDENSTQFEAVGPTEPTRLGPRETAVEVHFDLLATKMSFKLPSFACLVTENEIALYVLVMG